MAELNADHPAPITEEGDEATLAAIDRGIKAACELGAANGIRRISAGNYGGKLGQFQYHLREIMNDKSLGEPA